MTLLLPTVLAHLQEAAPLLAAPPNSPGPDPWPLPSSLFRPAGPENAPPLAPCLPLLPDPAHPAPTQGQPSITYHLALILVGM